MRVHTVFSERHKRYTGGWLSLSVLAVPVLAMTAFCLETHVIPPSDLRKRVPMTTLFYGHEPVGVVHAPDFMLTETEDGSKLAEGQGRSGRSWRLSLPPTTRGLWEAERNGGRTYYFAGYTGGAGMAPDTWILVLSFDEQRQPVPFYLSTYSGYDSAGIKDALDLDGTGPELLQQSWVETKSPPNVRSGFYITALYQRRGDYWYRADGQHGMRAFPLFEKWSALPKTEPQLVPAPPHAERWLTDLGNDPASGVRTTIVGIDDHTVRTGPELGCTLDRVGVVVQDSAAMRRVEIVAADFPGRLLPEMAHAQMAVTMTGVSHGQHGECNVSTIWSSKE